MKFAENYNKWNYDKETLQYYKLKYAAQLGEDAERLAFSYYENEKFRRDGVLYGMIRKRESVPLSDKPVI